MTRAVVEAAAVTVAAPSRVLAAGAATGARVLMLWLP